MDKKQFNIFLVIVSVIWIVLMFLIPYGSFWSGDMGVKFIQLQNFNKKGILDASIDYPAKEIDPTYEFNPIPFQFSLIKEDKMYFQYPLFFTLAVMPFYNLFSYFGLYLLPFIFFILSIVFFNKILKIFFDKKRIFPLLVFVFSTPMFFYSLVFWEHSLSVFLFTASIYLVLSFFKEKNNLGLYVAGLLMALSAWFRTEMLFAFAGLFLGLIIYWFKDVKNAILNLLRLSGGFIVGIIPALIMQKIILGTFLGNHITSSHDTGLNLAFETKKEAIYNYFFATDIWYQISNFTKVFFILVVFIIFLFIFKNVVSSFYKKSAVNKKIYFIDVILLFLLFGLVLISLKTILNDLVIAGLFTATPFVIFAFSKFFDMDKKLQLLFNISIINVVLFFVFAPVKTFGLSLGPRYFLHLYPFFVILGFIFFNVHKKHSEKNFSSRIFVLFFILLIIISLIIQAQGIFSLYKNKAQTLSVINSIRDSENEIIVTDVWSLAQESAPIFYEKKFMYVKNNERFEELIKVLDSKRITDFSFFTKKENKDYENISDVLVLSESEDIVYYGTFKLVELSIKQ